MPYSWSRGINISLDIITCQGLYDKRIAIHTNSTLRIKCVEVKGEVLTDYHSVTLPSTALKKAFAVDKTVQKMAQKDFVMLNLMVIDHQNKTKSTYTQWKQ